MCCEAHTTACTLDMLQAANQGACMNSVFKIMHQEQALWADIPSMQIVHLIELQLAMYFPLHHQVHTGTSALYTNAITCIALGHVSREYTTYSLLEAPHQDHIHEPGQPNFLKCHSSARKGARGGEAA